VSRKMFLYACSVIGILIIGYMINEPKDQAEKIGAAIMLAATLISFSIQLKKP
jgi:hypothetical protein